MPDQQNEYYMDYYIKNAKIKSCDECPYKDKMYGCIKTWGNCPLGKKNNE